MGMVPIERSVYDLMEKDPRNTYRQNNDGFQLKVWIYRGETLIAKKNARKKPKRSMQYFAIKGYEQYLPESDEMQSPEQQRQASASRRGSRREK